MKKYNKPVFAISEFEAADVIAISIWFDGESDQDELQAVYKKYVTDSGTGVNDNDRAIVLEW